MVLCLLFVAFLFFFLDELSLSPYSRTFSILFNIKITSLGKGELVCMILAHSLVYIACATFCLFLFLLASWVRCDL